MLLAVALGLAAFSGYGFGAWVPAFLGRVHEMVRGEIGTWIGLANGIGGAAGSVARRLARRPAGRTRPALVPVGAGLTRCSRCRSRFLFLLVANHAIALAFFFAVHLLRRLLLGPVIAITYLLVKVRMRALASAILLFILNLIGLGGGPQVVGILNDALAPRLGAEAVLYSL